MYVPHHRHTSSANSQTHLAATIFHPSITLQTNAFSYELSCVGREVCVWVSFPFLSQNIIFAFSSTIYKRACQQCRSCFIAILLILFSRSLVSLALARSTFRLFLQSPANPDLLYIIFFCHTQLTVTLLLALIFGSKVKQKLSNSFRLPPSFLSWSPHNIVLQASERGLLDCFSCTCKWWAFTHYPQTKTNVSRR